MRRFSRLILVAWAATWSAQADQISELEKIYGRADLAMISGMGGLTVGVNGRGCVSLCKWPSPGYDDQLHYRTRIEDEVASQVEAGQGLLWGLRIEGEIVWMNDPRWTIRQRYNAPTDTVMVTESTWPGSKIVVTQRVAVLPMTDTFVSALELVGFESAPGVYWYANFAPCTRHIPELPIADWMLDAANDFAAFTDYDKQIVVHFRPDALGKEDWETAKRLVESSARPDEWEAFGEGVWIGYQAFGGFQAASCGTGIETPSAAAARLSHLNGSASAATGQCHSIVELTPRSLEDSYHASVTVAFGDTAGEMRDALGSVADAEAASLLQAAAAAHTDSLRLVPTPTTQNPEIAKYLSRALLTLLASRDSETGSVVRSPAVQPPLARDWPRNGAWVIFALDLAGAHDVAEKHLNFYLERVRTDYARGKPMGSLAASTYTDGMESSPHLVVDDQAVSWLLWALNEHLRLMPSPESKNYLTSHWENISLCADFIAQWKDNRRGAPLWSKDPITLRDLATQESLFATKLGLDSVIAIAEESERPPDPLWVERQLQVDTLIRGLLLEGRMTWEAARSLPMFLSDFAEMDEQDFDEAVQVRLDASQSLSGYAAAKAFCDAVMAWRGEPEKLERARPYALSALENALTRPAGNGESTEREPLFPDALSAALCIAAIEIVFPFSD